MIPAATGFALGLLFYLGLWFTVRHLATTAHPILLTTASYWLRMSAVLAAFLWVMRGSWQNALLCLAGFIVARIAVSRWVACR
jgi:F1F0 ATPase subunit 2